MNFLAHLWLAERTATSPAGAVLGDWVRGPVPHEYAPELRLGIALHRRVDVATDAHPAVAQIKRHFAQGRRRYAGIILDLVTDHLLARRWQEFNGAAPLADFAARCARDVAANSAAFELAGGYVPGAAEFERLLLSYAASGGIDRALRRTAQRLRVPQGLLDAAREWPVHAAMLEPHLPRLLADIAAVAAAFVRDAQTTPPDLAPG